MNALSVPGPDGPDAPRVGALERALDVLQELVDGPPERGVSELAQALNMPKGSVHRILSALGARGLVQQDARTQRYSLGWAALRLGIAYQARADVTTLGPPVLEELSATTQETATLSIRVGRWQRIYAAQVHPAREVFMTVSEARPYPLHSGGSGRALLAFLPEREQSAYLARCAATPQGVEVEQLRESLAVTRARGWTESRGEHMPGAASVAAPVFDHRGEAVAALSVCGPVTRFSACVESHRVDLLAATRALSAHFGWMV